MNEPIVDSVKQFILTEFLQGESPENLKEDTPLMSSGILDSMSTLKLVEFLERSFDIVFKAYEVDRDNLNDLQKIAAFVEKKKRS
jgi:acyl carrier protein